MLFWLFYLLIFLATTLMAVQLFRFLFNAHHRNKNLQSRTKWLKMSPGKQVVKPNPFLKTKLETLAGVGTARSAVSKYYRQSGLNLTIQQNIAVLSIVFFANLSILLFLNIGYLPAAAGSVFLAIVESAFFVARKRKRRIARIVTQLPEALDMLVRSLESGHPPTAALGLVASEMAEPIGGELAFMTKQLTFGSNLEDAVQKLAIRVQTDEFRMFAVSVSVQQGTGGNLAEVLENLSEMIRSRIMMKAKIRAISAEGRITAMVMAVFPLILFLLIRTLSPTYFDPLWESGYGSIVVGACGGLILFGVVILNKLVNFDF